MLFLSVDNNQFKARESDKIMMTPHRKNEQFRNEIRFRQKQKILTQMRAKLHYCTPIDNLCNPQFVWQSYIKNPTPIVTVQVLRYFVNIQIKTIAAVQRVVNQILEAGSINNVIFVTLLVQFYQIDSFNFFQKALECKKESSNFQELKHYTKVHNLEQIYISYYIKYLSKLKPKQKVSQQQIMRIKQYFVEYWNSNTIQKTWNFQLCAEMAERLMKFRNISGLESLIKAVTSVLIEEDDSPQTYFLVKMALSCGTNSSFQIVLNPSLFDFLNKGLKQNSLKTVLQILEIIMQKVDLYDKADIKYFQLLKSMFIMYMKTETATYENYLLSSFYNFAFSEIKQVEAFFIELGYEQMFLKTKSQNFYSFLDFCICALYNYPCVQLYNKIIDGHALRLIQLSCDHILMECNQKTWLFARDLFEALQKCEQLNITRKQSIQVKLQKIKNCLESIEWNVSVHDKQELLNSYEDLIEKCRKY